MKIPGPCSQLAMLVLWVKLAADITKSEQQSHFCRQTLIQLHIRHKYQAHTSEFKLDRTPTTPELSIKTIDSCARHQSRYRDYPASFGAERPSILEHNEDIYHLCRYQQRSQSSAAHTHRVKPKNGQARHGLGSEISISERSACCGAQQVRYI